MITTDEIKTMSRADKIRLMEELWEDLSNDGDIKSPDWHEDALRETELSVAEGTERKMEWNSAKRELRSKFE